MSYLERLRQLEREKTVPPTAERWLAAFRKVAGLTAGIRATDIRFVPLMRHLDACDAAYQQGAWLAFQRHANLAEQVTRLALGIVVQWQSIKGLRQATVTDLIHDTGTTWVAVEGGLVRIDLLQSGGVSDATPDDTDAEKPTRSNSPQQLRLEAVAEESGTGNRADADLVVDLGGED